MARKDAPKGDVQRIGSYTHPTTAALVRPEIGTPAQFRKKKPSARYRYDSSLSPAFDWDGQNSVREEQQLGQLVLFNWPSNGSPAGYLPDREDAHDLGRPVGGRRVDAGTAPEDLRRPVARHPACRCGVWTALRE